MSARTEPFRVERVAAEELHDLRRRVLRSNDPRANVQDERDGNPESWHFAGVLDSRIVASGSFFPTVSPGGSALSSYQLRFLATDADHRGRGFGSVLMRAAESRLCSAGAEELWANARDSALGFYVRERWLSVPGSEHFSVETQLPHTVIRKSIHSTASWTRGWANVNDVEDLASLREEMHFGISLRAFDESWIAASAAYFHRQFLEDSLVVAVARTDDGEVIASAAATLRQVAPIPRFPQGSSAYIHTVSTRPAYRRRGISRALMDALLEDLRARQLERVELHAAPDGEAIYRSMGFEERRSGPELRLALRPPAVN